MILLESSLQKQNLINMRKNLIYFIAIVIVIGIFGCGKYEEGPGVSLRSKKARVANLWKVEYAFDLEDKVEITADYTGEQWQFSKDGSFTESSDGVLEKTGNWEFINDKDEISISTPGDMDVYQILKLKENEMWILSQEEEIHLVTN